MPEPCPAITLLNLRRLARNAQRNNTPLNPRDVLDLIDGKAKA